MGLCDEVLVCPSPSTPLPASIVIRQVPDAGRSLFTTTPLGPSAVVHDSGPPFARCVIEAYRREVCEHCFLHQPEERSWDHVAKDSKGRGMRWFCSEVCLSDWKELVGERGVQEAEWGEDVVRKAKRRRITVFEGGYNGPSTMEEVMKAWEDVGKEAVDGEGETMRDDDDEDIVRLMVDSLVSGRQETLSRTSPSSKPNRPTWLDLQSLVPSFSRYLHPDSGRAALYSHIRIYRSLRPLLASLTLFQYISILTRDAHNSFGIWEDSSLLAYGIYPSSSYFNHSCEPNLKRERRGCRNVFVVADEDEGVKEGAEVLISYLGGGEIESRAERREKLKEEWGFDCACRKCEREGVEEGLEQLDLE